MTLEDFVRALLDGTAKERGSSMRPWRRLSVWLDLTETELGDVAVRAGLSYRTALRYRNGERQPPPRFKRVLLTDYGFRW